jgi:hypothetical protein
MDRQLLSVRSEPDVGYQNQLTAGHIFQERLQVSEGNIRKQKNREPMMQQSAPAQPVSISSGQATHATPASRVLSRARDSRLAEPKSKITLSSHTIRVKLKRDPEPTLLGKFDGTKSFRDEFLAFVESLRTGVADPATRSLLSVVELGSNTDSVWGEIHAGEFGKGGPIVDSETMATSYRQKRSEAKLHPFTFLLNAPAGANKGIFVLQRHSAQGIQSAFMAKLKDFFGKRNPDYLVVIEPHVPAAVLRHLLTQGVKKVTVKTYAVPKDVNDVVKFQGNLEELATITTVVQARRGKLLPLPGIFQPNALRDILDGKKKLAEIVDVDDGGKDDVTITFDYNGSQRSINLRRPGNMAPYINIEEEVETGEHGHPLYSSVLEAAQKLLRDVHAEIGSR